MRRSARSAALVLIGLSLAWACGFDDTLREYLNVHFWLPFAKAGSSFAKDVKRSSAPFAGMTRPDGSTALKELRAAYQEIATPNSERFDAARLAKALAAARFTTLSAREREEVDLIDAKIDMRAGSPENAGPLESAKRKLNTFLQRAHTPEYLSEARGWLAYVYYLLGEQTAAGKIYLDELNRPGSNLSREILVNSLRMNYGYDGGDKLLQHLDEYFDTAEHAAFAIQLATNPRWVRDSSEPYDQQQPVTVPPIPYARIKTLLERHSNLLRTEKGADLLALLGMRTALRAGDPPAALRIAQQIPATAKMRGEPDFHWMLGSAHFLSRQYAAAEAPLLRLFRSAQATKSQKSAAAYGLCGVYQKLGNRVEQIRYALWLNIHVRKEEMYLSAPGIVEDYSVYWAVSGWDLNLLLDTEAPLDALRTFVEKYPNVPDVRLVRYAIAVRLARADRFQESAEIYAAINARPRAGRMRQMASLSAEANRADLSASQRLTAKYKLAESIAGHPDGIYFNDSLWFGLQRYALYAERDGRLTRAERKRAIAAERQLKDAQEERWRAYLLLRDVVNEAGGTDLGRRAAALAIHCVRGINTERFGRAQEIRDADIRLSQWLRRNSPPGV